MVFGIPKFLCLNIIRLTSEWYSNMLQNELQAITHTKQRKIHRVFFCCMTVHALHKMNQEVLDSTAHSPDLSSSDCHSVLGPKADIQEFRDLQMMRYKRWWMTGLHNQKPFTLIPLKSM